MFGFSDNNENGDISLHDRRAGKLWFRDGVLGFCFEDGFFVSKNNRSNPLGIHAFTGAAQVTISTLSRSEDDVTVFLFSKTHREDIDLRETVTVGRLGELLDKGMELEFLYSYKGFRSVIFECCLWSDTEPYHRECVLIIQTDSVYYNWNELYAAEDRHYET